MLDGQLKTGWHRVIFTLLKLLAHLPKHALQFEGLDVLASDSALVRFEHSISVDNLVELEPSKVFD